MYISGYDIYCYIIHVLLLFYCFKFQVDITGVFRVPIFGAFEQYRMILI